MLLVDLALCLQITLCAHSIRVHALKHTTNLGVSLFQSVTHRRSKGIRSLNRDLIVSAHHTTSMHSGVLKLLVLDQFPYI